MPREEKEEKKNKKAKRMKTKEEQRAEKSKKEEKEKLEQKENKSEKSKKKVKVEKTDKKQKKEIEKLKKVEELPPKEEMVEQQQEKKEQKPVKKKIREKQTKEQQEEQQEETQKGEQQKEKQKEIQEVQEVQKEKQENKQQEEQKKETKEKKQENKTETKDLMLKESPLNELQLEKIEKEIKTQAVITEEKKSKIYRKIFQNIAIAIGIVLYFIFINLGFNNIKPETFYKDLQVFSIISIIFTIVLMEKAYKKDNNELTIHTIEALIFSICTLFTIYIRNYYPNKFMCIINTISILFAIYYVGKCIIIDYKMTKKAKKRAREKRKLLNE